MKKYLLSDIYYLKFKYNFNTQNVWLYVATLNNPFLSIQKGIFFSVDRWAFHSCKCTALFDVTDIELLMHSETKILFWEI